MATVGRTSFTEDREDDGPTAERDFPAGCVSVPRHFQENTNRTVEATNREEQLPDNFYKLSPRNQFFERCGLFNRLLRHFKLDQNTNFNRPDLEAMKQMNMDSSSFKFEGLGPVPGVEVGDTFDYRAEMFVVGLHRMQEAGIACVNLGNETIACSVVFSGGYRDDVDQGDVIYYSGHGGNDGPRVGKKEDQKLKAGNRGLLNSLKQKKPVRVIRGLKNGGRTIQEILNLSEKMKKFSYDGLYTVTEHDFVDGKGGHKIHTFKLVREPRQPALDMNRVGF